MRTHHITACVQVDFLASTVIASHEARTVEGYPVAKRHALRFDEIGYWSEIKLDIVRDYASAYSKVLSKQPGLHHLYIDAFAGAGTHIAKGSREFVAGSPLNALNVEPPFREFHFIELHPGKAAFLKEAVGNRSDVHVYVEDCNVTLLETVFPTARYRNYRRALCLLDPYGLHLDWQVIKTAGEMRSVEIFLNFPVADMNRNVFWRNPEGVDPRDVERMNAFWGDDSWRRVAYRTEPGLFEPIVEKEDNETIAEAFRERLRKVAGFACVPKPLPMRNSTGAIVYYLFFASQNRVGEKIVEHIFTKYMARGSTCG